MRPNIGNLFLADLIAVQFLQALQKVTLGHHTLGRLPGNFLKTFDDGHAFAHDLDRFRRRGKASNLRNVRLVQIGQGQPGNLQRRQSRSQGFLRFGLLDGNNLFLLFHLDGFLRSLSLFGIGLLGS